MKIIIEGISDGSIKHLSLIDEISEYLEEVKVSTYPDPDIIGHDKFSDKEYFLSDEIDFDESYSVIFDVILNECGFIVDGELYDDLGDDRGLSYEISRVNRRLRKVSLQGVLRGGYSEIDEEAIAKVSLQAISNKDYLKLNLYKELAVDAYLLEQEANVKMAFFTYFSAMEAIIRYKLDTIQEGIYAELHDALEHLSLDDKVRIVAKNCFNTDDLKTVAIWGEFQGALRDIKKTRNLMAHGKLEQEISLEDLYKCIACYVVVYCFSLKNCKSFKEIKRCFQ